MNFKDVYIILTVRKILLIKNRAKFSIQKYPKDLD